MKKIERKEGEKKRRAQFWSCDGAPQGVTSCGGRGTLAGALVPNKPLEKKRA